MPGSSLIAYEKQFTAMAPRFEALLSGQLAVNKLVQSLMVSLEKTPRLLECSQQSVINAAISSAVLGLACDGVLGQAFIIPYKDRAQLVIGYKGYNTLAARAGMTIDGQVIRDGDLIEYEFGSNPFIRHVPLLGNNARIIGAWACATSRKRPPAQVILSLDQIMAVKAKSPGARKSDSPWNDVGMGFEAMASKTAKRRLARSMPSDIAPQYAMAARLDELHDEQGVGSYVDPKNGIVLEGEISEPAAAMVAPSADQLIEADFTDEATTYKNKLAAAAAVGMAELERVWKTEIPAPVRDVFRGPQLNEWKEIAGAVTGGA